MHTHSITAEELTEFLKRNQFQQMDPPDLLRLFKLLQVNVTVAEVLCSTSTINTGNKYARVYR